VAGYLLFLLNGSFWRAATVYYDGRPVDFAAFIIVLALLHFCVLLAFSAPYVIKPVFIALVMIGAGASYFVDTFGTIIDRDMIANAIETTSTEAGHLMTPAYFMRLAIFGAIPSLLIVWVQIIHLPWWKKVRRNIVAILGCLVVAAALIAIDFSTVASMWRAEREHMMSYLVPATPVIGAISYGVKHYHEAGLIAAPLGTDAHIGPVLATAGKPVLTVLVVGETARAMNFGLNGYARDTNPALEKRDVIAFTNVTSCGTATAVSLPCMFSNLGRDNYTSRKFLSSENLVDVLTHAGIDTRWAENNTGSKKVADRIDFTNFYGAADPQHCRGGECTDDVLLGYLRAQMAHLKTNTVLVLHSGGSHGPAYYLRYPETFHPFQPDCRSPQLSDCTDAEIINAYDNSIAYTDKVLADIVDLLEARTDLATSMIYISDHGESLGENGTYLHGLPYFAAPETQIRVPMIAWLSTEYAQTMRLDASCLRGRASEPLSHDNLFSTVLGMMNVQTTVYDRNLDAFAACRAPAPAA
jgi:lipid A ethanolaminephosphotransferase